MMVCLKRHLYAPWLTRLPYKSKLVEGSRSRGDSSREMGPYISNDRMGLISVDEGTSVTAAPTGRTSPNSVVGSNRGDV